MRTFPSAALLLLLLATGCSQPIDDSSTNPPTVDVQVDDAEMKQAIATAQATLTNFVAALQSPKPNQKFFLIKGRFTHGDLDEHIWVAEVAFDGKTFRGVIANEPESIPGLVFKQPVEVQPTQVSDWMFVQDDILVGGYTSRVLRKRMTDEERREQDARNPYRYE